MISTSVCVMRFATPRKLLVAMLTPNLGKP